MKLRDLLFALGVICPAAPVTASAYQILTNHDNVGRTGLVTKETILTPSNVSGLKILFQSGVDGQVYAQPLCVTRQLVYRNGVSAGKQSVVYVATEHGTVYAFDAVSGATYWQVSVIDQGYSPVQSSDPNMNGCDDLAPEIGITATPVIDRSAGRNGRIFVLVMETDGQGNYYYKLHALDLATGKEALTPAIISGSVSGQGPATTFVPIKERSRVALLLLNGVLYFGFGAFCDPDVLPYAGWLFGYNESSLSQVAIFNDNPNGSPPSKYLIDGSGGGIWQTGLGPSTDGQYIYVATGNGPFDQTLSGGFPASQCYGDSVLKLATKNGLSVSDYFTPYNQQQEANADVDLASGGVVVLPAIIDTHGKAHHLLVATGKDTNIYLLNWGHLGKFNASGNNIYQEIDGVNGRGAWSSIAYFNNSIYTCGFVTTLKRFQFDFSNPDKPLLGTTPAAQTSEGFNFPGFTPAISANGTRDGIVWGYEYNRYTDSVNAILHAYDAITLTELYNSGTQLGNGVKFAVPTICNGRVYIGTANSLVAFGL
jgi:PQQ-like domain